jgi:hypothetical protein
VSIVAVLSGKEWVGPAEAARRLGLSGSRVRQLIGEGRLAAVVTPLGRIVPVEAVEAEARRRRGVGGESESGGAHG